MNIKNAKQFLNFRKHAQKCKSADKAFMKTAVANEKIMTENQNIKNK